MLSRSVIIIALFLILIVPNKLLAQDSYFEVNVYLKDIETKELLLGATIKVFEDEIFVDSTVINQKKEIHLRLNFDYVYKLYFIKPGYTTKFLVFNLTNIPKKDQISGSGVDINLSLEKYFDDDISMSFKKYPIALFSFDTISKDIFIDKEYNTFIVPILDSLKNVVKEKLKLLNN